ncbi:hypothetical protein BH10PLA1_BH10PLA1_07260 [soil metagenome]
MKYKTLCRLLLKLFGVNTMAGGVQQLWYTLTSLVTLTWTYSALPARSTQSLWPSVVQTGLSAIGQLGIGLYLIAGSKWIVDKLVPSNRPYCHECGYELTGAVGNVCPECGTEFSIRSAGPEPHQ